MATEKAASTDVAEAPLPNWAYHIPALFLIFGGSALIGYLMFFA